MPDIEATWNPSPDSLEAAHKVLDAVRVGGCRSRQEIVARTGLGRAVAAQRVADLIDAGLVSEEGLGASTGGRPPRQLAFNSGTGRVLVADLGATSIDIALADLGGDILAHRSEAADIAAGPDPVLERVLAVFRDVVDKVDDGVPVLGVGIGLPGPVEFSQGRVAVPPIMPGWDGYPVRDRLEGGVGVPVWVDNDVNVMALGEWRAGAAKGHQTVVYLKVGTGIGAGLISDGQLHRGVQGSAGDVGHIQITDDPVLCRCGNKGCLEAMAGGAAIGRDAVVQATSGGNAALGAILAQQGTLSARDVSDAASRGDPASIAVLERSAHFVGMMLSTVVNLFNPSMIVIGGGVAAAGDRYLAAIRQTVYRRSLPLATRNLQIVPSALGPMAGVIGAAAMVVDELFSRQELARTLARLAAVKRASTAPPQSVSPDPLEVER